MKQRYDLIISLFIHVHDKRVCVVISRHEYTVYTAYSLHVQTAVSSSQRATRITQEKCAASFGFALAMFFLRKGYWLLKFI